MRILTGLFVLGVLAFAGWFLFTGEDRLESAGRAHQEGAASFAGEVESGLADAPADTAPERTVDAPGPVATAFDETERLLLLERPDDAAEMLQDDGLAAADPVRYHLLQSEIYLLRGDYPMALGAADRVLGRDPANAAAFYQRAQARIGIEEYREAIDDITRVIDLTDDPDLRAHAIEQREAWLEVYRPPGPPAH